MAINVEEIVSGLVNVTSSPLRPIEYGPLEGPLRGWFHGWHAYKERLFAVVETEKGGIRLEECGDVQFMDRLPPPSTIYVVMRFRRYEGEHVTDYGMVTTSKEKAEAFAKAHEGFVVSEIKDGDEYPSIG